MRISAVPRKGFQTKPTGAVVRVLMDEKPLERVVAVDTCTGVAWVHEVDRAARLRIDRARQEIVERRVYGPMRVEIVKA